LISDDAADIGRDVAWACTERTIENWLVMAPSLGRTPVGHRTPLTVSGAEAAGVTPAVFLKSKVSTWLGAPAIKMKMTLVALLMVVIPWLVQVPD
jgi:hypothetical protein